MPLQIIGQSPLPLENACACVRACVREGRLTVTRFVYIVAPPKKPLSLDWCTRRYYDCPFLFSPSWLFPGGVQKEQKRGNARSSKDGG